jgi:hypothetical protein
MFAAWTFSNFNIPFAPNKMRASTLDHISHNHIFDFKRGTYARPYHFVPVSRITPTVVTRNVFTALTSLVRYLTFLPLAVGAASMSTVSLRTGIFDKVRGHGAMKAVALNLLGESGVTWQFFTHAKPELFELFILRQATPRKFTTFALFIH